MLGIPSAIACAFLTWESVRLSFVTASPSSGTSGDPLVDLFVSGFRLFAKLFELLGGLGKWLIALLAIASFVGVAIAVILFVTARGLQAGRSWARIVGIALTAIPLLISVSAAVGSAKPLSVALSAMTAAASIYVIWSLGWRFAT